jgi:hypothetical protein
MRPPEKNCAIQFVWLPEKELCMAMCWGGTVNGGPAISWVPDHACDKKKTYSKGPSHE